MSWRLGVDIGLSAHTGDYDESGDNNLTIAAADLTLDGRAAAQMLGFGEGMTEFLSPFEFLAEGAYASIGRNSFARASGVPDDMYGYYTQLNYHFFPGFIDTLADKGYLDPDSHFTGVVRWGETDLDGFRRRRLTLGINFRPNQWKTVIEAAGYAK